VANQGDYWAVRWRGEVKKTGRQLSGVWACKQAFGTVDDTMRVLKLAGHWDSLGVQTRQTLLQDNDRWQPPRKLLTNEDMGPCRRCRRPILRGDSVPDGETANAHRECPQWLSVVGEEHPQLEHWTQLLDEVHVSRDLLLPLACCRPELITLVERRAITPEEHGALLGLVRVLLETNASLQDTCRKMDDRAGEIARQARGLKKMGESLDRVIRDMEGLVREARWGEEPAWGDDHE
jgi:hypothetical protein